MRLEDEISIERQTEGYVLNDRNIVSLNHACNLVRTFIVADRELQDFTLNKSIVLAIKQGVVVEGSKIRAKDVLRYFRSWLEDVLLVYVQCGTGGYEELKVEVETDYLAGSNESTGGFTVSVFSVSYKEEGDENRFCVVPCECDRFRKEFIKPEKES